MSWIDTIRDASFPNENVTIDDVNLLLAGYTPATQKGVANGIATLDVNGKIPVAQLPEAVVGALKFQGTYNATTNTPALPTAANANLGWYYVVAVAGNGYGVGDWVLNANGTAWTRLDAQDAVSSVCGKVGAVTLVPSDITGIGALASLNTVGTSQIDNSSVTDAKIATVAGSKVSGNIAGNAGNITGIAAVANGGTGASSQSGARSNLGLGALAVLDNVGSAQIAQMGAATNQYLKWNGTAWVPADVAAGGVSVMQMACAHSLGGYETLYIAGPSMASSGEIYAIAWVMPVAGTLSKIAVRISDAQPDQTTVVTLRKNGVDTAVTVTIPANANADVYLNTSGSVAVAAGDRISVKVYNDGSGQSATIRNVAVSLS